MDYSFDELQSTSESVSSRHDNSWTTVELSRGDSPNTNLAVPDKPIGIEEISNKVEDLVERINTSRASDQQVTDIFQQQLLEKVSEIYQQLKEQLYTVYDDNSNKMQEKLRELSQVLENCSRLNHELVEATQALACLRDSV